MLQSRIAVVTGAAGGMGQAVCQHLLDHSWQVLGIDHNGDRLGKLARDNPSFHPIECDLEDPELIDFVMGSLSGKGEVMGLVNLAGVSRGAEIEGLSDDDWSASFTVNVDVPMRLIRKLAPLMPAGSSIVNVGSPVGLVGARKASYAASKAALHGLTMSCARNLGARNIRVNLLLPGPTLTGMTRDWSSEKQAGVASGTFLNRLCQPEEVASVVGFLLSPSASYMTASVVDLTAGSLWGH